MSRTKKTRILSLDHSGSEFEQVGERDPVIGRLQARFPGLRPVLFNSPKYARGRRIPMDWFSSAVSRQMLQMLL